MKMMISVALLLVSASHALSPGSVSLLTKDLPVTQSTTTHDGDASRALDGNANADYFKGSCTHTGNSEDEWWKVALAKHSFVDEVKIFNRQDCCSERLNGARVFLDDHLCGEIKYVEGTTEYVVSCHKAGDEIKIEHSGQYLTLCEVQAFGYAVTKLHNLLRDEGVRAIQGSVDFGGEPARAIDGNHDGIWTQNSCTHTKIEEDNSSWWKAILPHFSFVKTVKVWNRMDTCCSDRIDGVKVVAEASSSIKKVCGQIEYVEGKEFYELECNSVAQKISVYHPEGDYLTLCEVEAFGVYRL